MLPCFWRCVHIIRILFVCHGNICRSVMAECIFADLAEKAGLGDCFEVDSAATSTEEIGNPIYPPARRKLEEKGVPVRPHRARKMTASDAEQYDLLVTAGSDYHGRNKLIEPGDTGLEPGMDYPERLCRFLEEISTGRPVGGASGSGPKE